MICGLERAKLLPVGPFKQKRATGSRAAGLRYERALARELKGAVRGQWFAYEDANGPGICQTDLLFVWQNYLVVVECKLSRVEEGIGQLSGLYLPIARKLWPKKIVVGVVATRHLSQWGGKYYNFLDEAILAGVDGPAVHHWMEKTPVWKS